jgi:hypothetical protein
MSNEPTEKLSRHAYHFPGIRVDIMSHCILEWLQEIFLELEMRQFILF